MSRETARVLWACFGAGFVPASFAFLLCAHAPNIDYGEFPHILVVPLFFWGLSALLGAACSIVPLVNESFKGLVNEAVEETRK